MLELRDDKIIFGSSFKIYRFKYTYKKYLNNSFSKKILIYIKYITFWVQNKPKNVRNWP